MKTVVIVNGSEPIEGEKELGRLGYVVERFQAVPATTAGTAGISPFSMMFDSRGLTEYESSLRNTWIAMLDAYKDVEEDILFCESDAAPRITAAGLRQLTSAVPMYDAYRPYLWLEHSLPDRVLSSISIFSMKELTDAKDTVSVLRAIGSTEIPLNNATLMLGTHAILVPKRGRERLKNAFTHTVDVVDRSLAIAVAKDIVRIGCTTQNLFVQHAMHKSSANGCYQQRFFNTHYDKYLD